MLLSRTLIKKKGGSNSIENPFLVSYRFLQHASKKITSRSSGEIALLLLVFCFRIFSSTNCDRQQNCSMFILEIAIKILFIIEQIQVKWLNIPNSGLFMFIGCTPMFCLLRCHLLLHIILCKTSMLKSESCSDAWLFGTNSVSSCTEERTGQYLNCD